ncbi:hypothetical protein HMPREF9946_01921 [Acetobacteraceae bacterium AT-5844]|nr:hypothetical protein HMPREF9946_01921 [Acetobacteraceae bacterium AT-5844]
MNTVTNSGGDSGAPDRFPLPDDLPASASRLTHPAEVAADPNLALADKRRILAAWLSDACALQDKPGFRQWINGAVAAVNELREALQRLDEQAAQLSETAASPQSRALTSRRRRNFPRRRPRDGDTLSPCPVLPRDPHDRPFQGGQAVALPWGSLQMDATWRRCAMVGQGVPDLPRRLKALSTVPV